jgi:hypothetical protein
MLRLRLTDGATPNAAIVVGVEHAPCPSLPDAAAMPPGSKLAVAPNARVQRRDGVLLFRQGDLAFLGGRVPRMIEAHEMARLAAQVADAEPRAVDDFPPFRAFRPERDAGFAERARTDAERPDPNAADGVVSEGSSRTEGSTGRPEGSTGRPEGSTGRPEGSTGRPEGSGGPEGSHAATGGLVPRRRPALPPTRAQRAAAAASGAPLPVPGQPMEREDDDGEASRRVPAEAEAGSEAGRGEAPLEKTTLRDDAAAPKAPLPLPRVDRDAQRKRLLGRMSSGERARGEGVGGRGGEGGRGGGRGGGERGTEAEATRRPRRRGDRGDRGDRGVRDDRGGVSSEASDEALARRLQRELDLEAGAAPVSAAADLAASLFGYAPAPEATRDADADTRGGRGGRR